MPDRLPASCRSRARYCHFLSINHGPMCQEWSIDLFCFFFLSFSRPTASRFCCDLPLLLPLLHFPPEYANSIMRGGPTKVSRPFRLRHRAFHDVVTSAIAFAPAPPLLPLPLSPSGVAFPRGLHSGPGLIDFRVR